MQLFICAMVVMCMNVKHLKHQVVQQQVIFYEK